MKSNVGLWIDHRETIIVWITGNEEKMHTIKSEMGKHVRYSGGKPEDQQENKFENHLNEYYDKVKSYLGEEDSILILGPAEAKVELSVRLKGASLGDRIAAIETADKTTDHQIAAKVWEYFLASTEEIHQNKKL